jgi:hypothetical protein
MSTGELPPLAVPEATGLLNVRGEFASVSVSVDTQGNGPRLKVLDHHTHQVIYLSPLELSALTACTHADLAPFMEVLRVPPALDDSLKGTQ